MNGSRKPPFLRFLTHCHGRYASFPSWGWLVEERVRREKTPLSYSPPLTVSVKGIMLALQTEGMRGQIGEKGNHNPDRGCVGTMLVPKLSWNAL